jgi:hypothetical protein
MKNRTLLTLVTVIGLLSAVFASGLTPASAATGDTVLTITADRGTTSPCKSTNPAGDHTGVGTGVAFDGTNLILSCWASGELDFVNPTTGAFVKKLDVSGSSDLGALAYDGVAKVLWACSSDSDVGSINLTTGVFTSAFTTGCVDGLAYDGKDGTLWASADASTTVTHNTKAGAVLGTFTVDLNGHGNSGLAVGGDLVYLGNDGGSEIFQSAKDLVSPTVFITAVKTGNRRVEDLECDNVTFAAQSKAVMWSQDAYDNILTAYEIPNGSCNYGGGVTTTTTTAAPSTTPTTTAAAKATAVAATPVFTG